MKFSDAPVALLKLTGTFEILMVDTTKLIPREIKSKGKVDWDSASSVGDMEELGAAGWAQRFGEQSIPPSTTV